MSGLKPLALAALAISVCGLAVSPCSAQFRRQTGVRPGTKPPGAYYSARNGLTMPHPSNSPIHSGTPAHSSSAHQGFVTANVSRMTKPVCYSITSPGDANKGRAHERFALHFSSALKTPPPITP
jgi:hypothetical protein